jgi:alkanesulfonate monooxygenase SsuD/methylene tetrahydromethanopterin reductase-like flavin-dependent oxidoreductase (luciferase family)
MRFGILVDFRNPPDFPRANQDVYRDTLETIQMAEALGYEDVWLSEHHFAEDGYCPSPLTVGAAIAVQTHRIAIGQSVFLLPLHNPLRVAEDAAVVDILSAGRLLFGPALGYRPFEFETLGSPRKQRASIFEEALEVIVQAWTQPEVNFEGRHFSYRNVKVRPQPVQKPRPPIWIGGLSRAAVHRAARLGDGLIAGGRRAYEWYLEGLDAAGKPRGAAKVAGLDKWYFVDDDPERLLSEIEPYLLYFHNTVVRWFRAAGQPMPMGDVIAESAAQLKTLANYSVCTPDECIERIVQYSTSVPVDRFYILATLPGLAPEVSRRWIRLFAEKVIPGVRNRVDRREQVDA